MECASRHIKLARENKKKNIKRKKAKFRKTKERNMVAKLWLRIVMVMFGGCW